MLQSEFWDLVDKKEQSSDLFSDHWMWIGELSDLGFGTAAVEGVDETLAHKVAAFLVNSEPPGRMSNKCGVRKCVNPDHWVMTSTPVADITKPRTLVTEETKAPLSEAAASTYRDVGFQVEEIPEIAERFDQQMDANRVQDSNLSISAKIDLVYKLMREIESDRQSISSAPRSEQSTTFSSPWSNVPGEHAKLTILRNEAMQFSARSNAKTTALVARGTRADTKNLDFRWSVINAVVSALRRNRVSCVEWSPGEVDDFTGYDVLVAEVPFAVDARIVFDDPQVDVIDAFLSAGKQVFFVATNWRTTSLAQSLIRDMPRLENSYNEANSLKIRRVISALMSNSCPLLVPTHWWGRHDLILGDLKPSDVLFFDPSPYLVDEDRPFSPTEKMNQWVFDSVSPEDQFGAYEKQAQWPILKFGEHRVFKISRGRADEYTLLTQYAESRGVIAFKHVVSGTGWYRNRYVYAALAKTIVVADPIDAAAMGPEFQFAIREVEGMSSNELDDLARVQSNVFWSKMRARPLVDDMIANFVAPRTSVK